jgi:prevent-host-death family protein
MVMIMVNIYEAKSKLSEYLDAAARGERVVICRHNQPVAELRRVEEVPAGPRDLTPMYPGETFVTSEFFEPLSLDEIAAWEGADEKRVKVAEQRAPYTATTGRKAKRKSRA